ncbi:MAG TPA: FecR family protein [Terriglobales bacterium]|nr:FecR family protein [Terriglobales bacterium]
MIGCTKISAAATRMLLLCVISGTAVWCQDAPAARVLEMTGRVSILRDNAEVALFPGSAVQPKQIVFTGSDGYAKFQLADGSTFEVFQSSKVVFRENPGNWQDLLDVVIGRVKVFIEHRNGPNHNRVTTQTAVISVRGTVFDVVVEDEDATTLVSVDEGLVAVQHRLLGGEVQLQAGESFRVFRNQPLAVNRVNKGSLAQKALRVAEQAVYDIMVIRGGPGGGSVPAGGGPTTTGGQGDKGKNTGGGTPPPPPPANPPPPPPPPPSGP